ncbi:hypothetical protein ACIRO1_07535 [Streptomyces sp. NPDC102381]|uniref:hypothetical protein n=1 Tax=Streptomyces sp. NPDC102381 TaxID=3366164 RepID=UPI00381D86A2
MDHDDAATGVSVGAYRHAVLAHQQPEVFVHLGEPERAADLLDYSLRHRPPAPAPSPPLSSPNCGCA